MKYIGVDEKGNLYDKHGDCYDQYGNPMKNSARISIKIMPYVPSKKKRDFLIGKIKSANDQELNRIAQAMGFHFIN
jgi:hypothetical protein